MHSYSCLSLPTLTTLLLTPPPAPQPSQRRSANTDESQEKKLLRDFIHPLPVYTAAAAERLLRRVYSNAFTRQGGVPEGASGVGGADGIAGPSVWWEGCGAPRPQRLTKVTLLRDAEAYPPDRGDAGWRWDSKSSTGGSTNSTNNSSSSIGDTTHQKRETGKELAEQRAHDLAKVTFLALSDPDHTIRERLRGVSPAIMQVCPCLLLACWLKAEFTGMINLNQNHNYINSRLRGVTPAVMQRLRQGPADILYLPRDRAMKSIPLGPPLLHTAFEKAFQGHEGAVSMNVSGALWLVASGEKRRASARTIEFFGHANASSSSSSSSAFFRSASEPRSGQEEEEGGQLAAGGLGPTGSPRPEQQQRDYYEERLGGLLLEFLIPGPPMPDIYFPGSLVRWAGSREVLVLLDGHWHPVPSAAAFVAHGWDFSQVQVVGQRADLDLVPMGSPL